MQRKIINFGALCAILTIVCSTPIVAAASMNYSEFWDINVGDEREWSFFDNYFFTELTTASTGTNHTISHIDASMKYLMNYDVIKEWRSGDIGLNISSTSSSCDSIDVIVDYFSIGGGIQLIRKFNDYNKEIIRTIIPLEITDIFNSLYTEEYTKLYGKKVNIDISGTNFLVDPISGALSIPPNLIYGTMGNVTVNYADEEGYSLYNRTYAFHYVGDTEFTKTPYKEYRSIGSRIEVAKIEDMDQDVDDIEDLLIAQENNVGVETPLGDFGITIPQYVDLSSITSIIALIQSLGGLASAVGADAGQSLQFMPFNLGFTLPSGMTTVYSDVANTFNSAVEMLPPIATQLVLALFRKEMPDPMEMINILLGSSLSVTSLFSTLLLVTGANFILYPNSTDFSVIPDLISILNDGLNLITVNDLSKDCDYSNVLYGLHNLLYVNDTGSEMMIIADGGILPILCDSRNGLASMEMRLGWNYKYNVFSCIEFEVNYPMNGFGHVVGYHFVDPDTKQDITTTQNWTKTLTDFLIVLLSFLGLGAIGIVLKKRSGKKPPFKDVIGGARCDDGDLCCVDGICPQR